MNKHRRHRLEEIMSAIRSSLEDLNAIADDEREAFENLPDSIQYSERGEKMEEIADTIDSAQEEIDSALRDIDSSLEN